MLWKYGSASIFVVFESVLWIQKLEIVSRSIVCFALNELITNCNSSRSSCRRLFASLHTNKQQILYNGHISIVDREEYKKINLKTLAIRAPWWDPRARTRRSRWPWASFAPSLSYPLWSAAAVCLCRTWTPASSSYSSPAVPRAPPSPKNTPASHIPIF